MKQFNIALVFFLLFATGVHAATFYVAKTGTDSNSCAQAQNLSTPKLTILAALNCIGGALGAGAGHTVQVSAGTYQESIDQAAGRPIPSGSSWNAPFTLTAKMGDVVTIKPSSGMGLRWAGSGNNSVYTIVRGFIWDGSGNFDSSLVATGGCCDGVSDVKFVGNDFTNIQASYGVAIAVNKHSRRADLLNNKFHDFITTGQCDNPATAYACGYPMYYGGSDGVIDGNEMYNIPAYGVHMYSQPDGPPLVSNNVVRNNRIHDFSRKTGSAAGILLATGENNQAYNNIIYNGAVGIAVSSANSKVHNNTIFNLSYVGIDVSRLTAGLIKNNIVYQANIPIFGTGTGNVVSNNLTTDPKFVSATDFRLQSGSPAIDGGTSLLNITISTDYAGGARPQGCCYDVGAYEYGAAPGSSISVASAISNTVSSATISVDSTYTGYSVSSIIDSLISTTGDQSSTWASNASPTDHWINLTFPSSQQINTATIFWAFNNYQQKYMTANKVDLQYWNGSSYQTVSTFDYPGSNVPSSTVFFPMITTSQLRFVMPAGQGNPDYANILWVTEIKYGIPTVTVDSTYTGYSASSLVDGVINAAGEQSTTWASDASSTDHWLNITLPSSQQINTATIYWAFNNYQQKYMTAKKLDVQYWNGSVFQTVSSFVYPGSNAPSSTVFFPSITTSQLKFVMPAGQGNPDYANILWMTEVKFGMGTTPTAPKAPSNVLVLLP